MLAWFFHLFWQQLSFFCTHFNIIIHRYSALPPSFRVIYLISLTCRLMCENQNFAGIQYGFLLVIVVVVAILTSYTFGCQTFVKKRIDGGEYG